MDLLHEEEQPIGKGKKNGEAWGPTLVRTPKGPSHQ